VRKSSREGKEANKYGKISIRKISFNIIKRFTLYVESASASPKCWNYI